MNETMYVGVEGTDIVLGFPGDTPPEVISQRVQEVAAQTERAEITGKLREQGLSNAEIHEYLGDQAPPGAYVGPMHAGRYEAVLGAGKRGWEGVQGVKQLLAGKDERGEIADEVAERRRLDEETGLTGSTAATVGSMLPYAPLAMAQPQTALGALAVGAAEGLAETATSPTTGEPHEFWSEKGNQALWDLGLGIGIPGAVEAAPRVVRAAKDTPDVLTDSLMNTRRASPEDIRTGDELAERTGVSLSPYERYQQPGAGRLEQWAAESPLNANRAQAIRDKKVGEYETFLNKFFTDQGLENLDPLDTAAKVQDATEDYVQELVATRRSMADADYSAVRAWEEGRPLVVASEYEKELHKIIGEGGTAGATQDQIKAAKVAEDRLGRLEEQYGALTGQDIEQVSRSGQVGGSVWDTANRSYEDVLNGRLRRAVDEDLAGHPDLQGLISTARSNYRANSDAIESIEKTGLGKVIGEELASDVTGVSRRTVATSKVLDKLWGEGTEEFAQNLAVIDRFNPEVGMELRLAYLRRAMDASKIRPSAGGVSGEIDYAAFLQALGVRGSSNARMENVEKMRALFAGTPMESMADDLYQVSMRLADSRFKNFSNTDVRREVGELVDSLTQTAFLATAVDPSQALSLMQKVKKPFTKWATQKKVLDRVDPDSGGYLRRGPRPELTIPRNISPTALPLALGLTNEDE